MKNFNKNNSSTIPIYKKSFLEDYAPPIGKDLEKAILELKTTKNIRVLSSKKYPLDKKDYFIDYQEAKKELEDYAGSVSSKIIVVMGSAKTARSIKRLFPQKKIINIDFRSKSPEKNLTDLYLSLTYELPEVEI